MTSVAAWELFLALFMSTEELVHHWGEKFWAAQCFQPASQQCLPLLFEKAGCESRLPFPREDWGKGGRSKQTAAHLCTYLSKQEHLLFADGTHCALGPKRAAGFWVAFLSCLCQDIPRISSYLGFPLLPEILSPSFAKSPVRNVEQGLRFLHLSLALRKPAPLGAAPWQEQAKPWVLLAGKSLSAHYSFPRRVDIYSLLMCFRSVRWNTDSQALHYSYFSRLNDGTRCHWLMNWAAAEALGALTEMRQGLQKEWNLKPSQNCLSSALQPCLALSPPRRLWPWVGVSGHGGLCLREPRTHGAGGTAGRRAPPEVQKECVQTGTMEYPRGRGCGGPSDQTFRNTLPCPWRGLLLNDAGLPFLETVQVKGRGFHWYIKYFLAKRESFSSEQQEGTA